MLPFLFRSIAPMQKSKTIHRRTTPSLRRSPQNPSTAWADAEELKRAKPPVVSWPYPCPSPPRICRWTMSRVRPLNPASWPQLRKTWMEVPWTCSMSYSGCLCPPPIRAVRRPNPLPTPPMTSRTKIVFNRRVRSFCLLVVTYAPC